MDSDKVTLTVQIPADERAAFLQLVEDFIAGRVRVRTPAIDFEGKTYRQAVAKVVSDLSASRVLRERVIEDDGRDPLESLADAEMLHALESKRFAEAVPVGAIDAPTVHGLEEAGVEALRRLLKVANGHSGKCRYVARFLLGLYNGNRFPFDLTHLRAIDDALFEDCMTVLRMDARLTRREVHNYIEAGDNKWEQLASDWKVVNVGAVNEAAKRLAEQVGPTGHKPKRRPSCLG